MITSLISRGASCKSNGETAIGVSVSSLDKTRETTTRRTHLRGSGNASEVVDQLEALLTGGRLGAATKVAVLDICLASGGPVENVKVAQQAVVNKVNSNNYEHQCYRSLWRVLVAITGRIFQWLAPKRTANLDSRC